MFQLRVLALIVIAYCVCSFSSAYFVGKWTKGIDPREYFSKNLGATNAFRVLGPLLGSTVLAFDVEKAALVMLFAQWAIGSSEHFWLLAVMCATLVGHMFPSYLRPIRGGKGIAVGAGCVLVLMPKALLPLLLIFVLVVAATKIVSLGSLLVASAFPTLVVHYYSNELRTVVLAALMSVLVVILHWKNIKALYHGTENRFGSKKPA